MEARAPQPTGLPQGPRRLCGPPVRVQPGGDHATTQQRARLLATGLPFTRWPLATARRPTQTYGSHRTRTDKSSTLTTS
eukprot:10343989-Prorocentrum_lima.AAC.1